MSTTITLSPEMISEGASLLASFVDDLADGWMTPEKAIPLIWLFGKR